MLMSLVVLVALGEVPAGVKYVKADAAANAKARATLEKMFSNTPETLSDGASQGVLILGPFLGQRLSRLDMSGFLKTTAMVPFGETLAEMSSYGSRNEGERKALLELLRDLAPKAPVTVRSMTAAEMKIVWPFISWELSEPLFVVESPGRRWLVDFDESGSSVFWIEDLTAPCFTSAALKGKCLCADALKEGKAWKLRFVERKACMESQGEKNPLRLEPSLVDLKLVTFLIPISEMEKRITVEALGAYVKRLMSAASAVAGEHKAGASPGAMTVFVGVKPDGSSRVWVTPSQKRPLTATLVRSLAEAMRAVQAPTPRGMIIFKIHVGLFGTVELDEREFPDIPAEWKDIVDRLNDRIDAESLVEKAWK